MPNRFSEETYAEKLQSPLWWACRRRIIYRDGGECQDCGTTVELQVHHIRYRPGLEPWESPDEDLITLCDGCHHKRHYWQDLGMAPLRASGGPVPLSQAIFERFDILATRMGV